MALGDRDVINAPAFARATVVAGNPPAQLTVHNKRGKVHCRRDEAARVAAPCVAASNGLPVPVAIIALSPPVSKLPPTAGSVMSVNAPLLI
jgi:hypothetical protein